MNSSSGYLAPFYGHLNAKAPVKDYISVVIKNHRSAVFFRHHLPLADSRVASVLLRSGPFLLALLRVSLLIT